MKLFLASGNAHKAAEFQAFAKTAALPVEIVSAAAVGGMPDVIEDAGTFAGNARKKARALRAKLPADAWALADDSGLCVEALGGAPGVESAYYAGPQHDSAANLRKLTEAMRKVPEDRRGAYFICVLVVLGPGGAEHVAEGRCLGSLRRDPAGDNGFGYDPLFQPAGFAATYAELDHSAKNSISHRARAWTKLLEQLAAAVG